MGRRLKTGLIKRYDLPMVYRKFEKDINNDDPWDNGESIVLSFNKVIAENCTVQTPSKNNIGVELQGLDPTNMFVVYTESFVPAIADGESELPPAIYLSSSWLTTDPNYPSTSGGWYKVKSVQQKLNRVINHYKLIIVKDDNVNADEYPDTSAFDTEVTTREEFLSGTWEATWLL